MPRASFEATRFSGTITVQMNQTFAQDLQRFIQSQQDVSMPIYALSEKLGQHLHKIRMYRMTPVDLKVKLRKYVGQLTQEEYEKLEYLDSANEVHDYKWAVANMNLVTFARNAGTDATLESFTTPTETQESTDGEGTTVGSGETVEGDDSESQGAEDGTDGTQPDDVDPGVGSDESGDETGGDGRSTVSGDVQAVPDAGADGDGGPDTITDGGSTESGAETTGTP